MKATLGLVISAVALLTAGAASADQWAVYIPPAPFVKPPPPFSTNTWIFVENVDDKDSLTEDNGEACEDEGMTLHYRYWNSGDHDAAGRAFQAMCVSRTTGTVMPSSKP